jgi:hypothetical protein
MEDAPSEWTKKMDVKVTAIEGGYFLRAISGECSIMPCRSKRTIIKPRASTFLFQFVGYLLLFLFIKHPGTMLQSFRYSGPLHIETTLNSLLDAQWLEPQGASFSARPGSELDDAVTFAIATTSELLRDAPDDVVADLLRYLFFAVNWSALVDSPENVQRLVRPDASSISGNAWEEAKSSQFTPVTSERDLLSPIAREPAKVVDNYEIDRTLLGLRKDASAST